MDTALGSRLLDLETMGSGSVWFNAFRTSQFYASSWATIFYDDARRSSNYPNAMSVSTGVFTAPLAGIYQFFIQVYKDYGVVGQVIIVFEGTTVSLIRDADTSYKASITGTAIVEMQPGQKVWAETNYKIFSSSTYPAIHFTGVLITPK